MTTGDEKQDVWVQQIRTVQKPRQRKVKEGHHDLSERKSIIVRRVNTLLTKRKENRLFWFFFKKKGRGWQEKGRRVPQAREITQIFPYFRENHRK